MNVKSLVSVKIFDGIPLSILLSLLVVFEFYGILPVKAQKPDFFITNGKSININEFNSTVNKMMMEIGIPALSLSIIENNKIAFTNAYGYKKLTENNKIDSATLFEACSLTKLYLVFAAFKLVDQGLLDLDKPMYQYLENERLAHDPRHKFITPRMILSHTAGLENWQRINNENLLEIVSEPGKGYSYSGEGFHYLADVMESILGESYPEYMKRLVLDPLDLRMTRLNHTQNDSTRNFAYGHEMLGQPLDKWITDKPWPAASIHTNAIDLSTLLMAMFDEKHLSRSSIKEISKSVKLLFEDKSAKYSIGNGIFVLTNSRDTIVNFAGDNTGFKADMMYSLVSKRGFVFFSNTNIGLVMGPALNKWTTEFDGNLYLASEFFNTKLKIASLIKTYRSKGVNAMMEEIRKENIGNKNAQTLKELMDAFFTKDITVSEKLAYRLLKYTPNLQAPYFVIGLVNLEKYKNYPKALKYFEKASSLKSNGEISNLDYYVNLTKDKIGKTHPAPVKIYTDRICTVQAEHFADRSGVVRSSASDVEGVEEVVGWITSGSWMDYNLNVTRPGTYLVELRVASLPGEGKVELRSGTKVLALVDIESTQGWEKWTTVKTQIQLPAGRQTLRIFSIRGGYNLNWLQFSSPVMSKGG